MKLLELLRKRILLEQKKVELASRYSKWVDNVWLNILALWGVGHPIAKLTRKKYGGEVRIVGFFLLFLWSLANVFILYKMITSLHLSKKIQKLSQKIAEIDRLIVSELSKCK